MIPSCLILDAYALGDLFRLGLIESALGIGIPVLTSPIVCSEVEETFGVNPCDFRADGRNIVLNQANLSQTLGNRRRYGLLIGEASVLALSEVSEDSMLVARFPQGRAGIRWLADRLGRRPASSSKAIDLLRLRWGMLPLAAPLAVSDRADSA
jgi:hypothetical protein